MDIRVPGGRWQQDAYTTSNKVDLVPIATLLRIRGNALGKTDLGELAQQIEDAGGLNEPLVIKFDPKRKRIRLGEGNHRAERFYRDGYTHLPTRGIRGTIADDEVHYDLDTMPELANHSGYVPADMRPSAFGVLGCLPVNMPLNSPPPPRSSVRL